MGKPYKTLKADCRGAAYFGYLLSLPRLLVFMWSDVGLGLWGLTGRGPVP